jgi:hypothetical protein
MMQRVWERPSKDPESPKQRTKNAVLNVPLDGFRIRFHPVILRFDGNVDPTVTTGARSQATNFRFDSFWVRSILWESTMKDTGGLGPWHRVRSVEGSKHQQQILIALRVLWPSWPAARPFAEFLVHLPRGFHPNPGH